jgi:hypothetical protein
MNEPDESLPDTWPDAKVLANADLEMPAAEDERLSDLLDRQQAGLLTPSECSELTALMGLYQQLLLRKAQGRVEAVRRGLRESAFAVRPTRSELLKMSREQRQSILGDAAKLAEQDYHSDRDLTEFEAFSEEERNDNESDCH